MSTKKASKPFFEMVFDAFFVYLPAILNITIAEYIPAECGKGTIERDEPSIWIIKKVISVHHAR